jgi:hypothetical protein
MSDISAFKKILEQPYDARAPRYVLPRVTWLAAYKSTAFPDRFFYRIGSKSSPLSKLLTYSLTDARAVAKSFGLPVHEVGPPEAFGRKRDTYAPSSRPATSTVDAFWVVVGRGDQERLDAWLADHPKDAPFLSRLLIAGRDD